MFKTTIYNRCVKINMFQKQQKFTDSFGIKP